jgi:hypothetical protein
MEAAEILKTDPSDFGGIQYGLLDEDGCRVRLCCAQGCCRPGWTQLTVAFGAMPAYRIVCRVHAVLAMMLSLSALGDSVPSVDIVEMARALGVNLRDLLVSEPEVVSLPDKWRCFTCGNGLLFEHFGADDEYGAWIHKCGVDRLHGR